jgi:hypothetical protein
LSFLRNSVSDGVQPGTHCTALTNGPGPAGKHAKDRLKGVFGILFVAEDAPANAQHEPAVPPHQDGEGRLLLLGREALQQSLVGQILRAYGPRRIWLCHDSVSNPRVMGLYLKVPATELTLPTFFLNAMRENWVGGYPP